MTQMNLPTKQKLTHIENRLMVVKRGEGSAIFLVFCILGVCEGNPHRGVTHVKTKKGTSFKLQSRRPEGGTLMPYHPLVVADPKY